MSMKWQIVYKNKYEYVQYGGRTFRCCRRNMPHPDTWVWIPEVKRWISPKGY